MSKYDDLNSIRIEGKLGQDPECRDVRGGKVIKFTVATNHSTKQDGEWVKQATWHKVEYFLGENDRLKNTEGFRKGKWVHVEGAMRERKYEGKDGQQKFWTFIAARRVVLVSGISERDDSGSASQHRSPEQPSQAADDIDKIF